MEQKKLSTARMLKYLVLIFILGNVLYILGIFFMGDMSMVREAAIQIGTAAALNAVLLLWVSCCEWLEQKRWSEKMKASSMGDGSFKLLKCSSGYFMFPIVAILLDAMFGIMVWREYKRDVHALLEVLQGKEIVFPIFFLALVNGACVFVILYYCCHKVCYTGHSVEVVHFLHKKKLAWGELQNIKWCFEKNSSRQKIILEAREGRAVLRSDLLAEGWEEFASFVKAMARKYEIKIIVKK